MQFVILAKDKPDSVALRVATRPAHLEYIKQHDAHVLGAGPFLNEKDEMIGSLVMIEFPDQEAAEAFAGNDPYALAGLFETVEIRRWRWAIKPHTA